MDWVQVLMENRMLEAQLVAHRESRLAAARSLLQNDQVQMPLHPPAASQVSPLPSQSLWGGVMTQHTRGGPASCPRLSKRLQELFHG